MDHAAIARDLLEAQRSRIPLPPLTGTHPQLGVEDAYRVQQSTVALRRAEGRRVVGYKVGLTSLAMQQQLGVDQPDFGHLFDDMVFDASAPVPLGGFIAPRVEPEVSFVLARDLRGPDLTADDVIAALDHAVVSLEIIDSRIADWRIGLADTIADNASSGGVLLGASAAVDAVDLATLPVTLRSGGVEIASGFGRDVLGHPVEGIRWLANTLGALGTTLEAGSIVMAGSVTRAVAVAPGDEITATFGELGELTVSFA